MVASFGVGLLFLVRGAILPYFFVMFQRLSNLNYVEIATLLNIFVLSQALASPITGGIIKQIRIKLFLVICFASLIVSLLLIILNNNFLVYSIAIFVVGSAIITLKNAFTNIVIFESPPDNIRICAAFRMTCLNIGSFLGNILTLIALNYFKVPWYIVLLMVITIANMTLVTILYKPSKKHLTVIKVENKRTSIKQYLVVLTDRTFLKLCFLLMPAILFDGCWGTIIPKFVVDVYKSNVPIAYMYTVSMITIVVLSIFINHFMNKFFVKRATSIHIKFYVPLIFFISGF